MKRFHVHVHVADLGQSIGFYSTMFGAAPARVELMLALPVASLDQLTLQREVQAIGKR